MSLDHRPVRGVHGWLPDWKRPNSIIKRRSQRLNPNDPRGVAQRSELLTWLGLRPMGRRARIGCCGGPRRVNRRSGPGRRHGPSTGAQNPRSRLPAIVLAITHLIPKTPVGAPRPRQRTSSLMRQVAADWARQGMRLDPYNAAGRAHLLGRALYMAQSYEPMRSRHSSRFVCQASATTRRSLPAMPTRIGREGEPARRKGSEPEARFLHRRSCARPTLQGKPRPRPISRRPPQSRPARMMRCVGRLRPMVGAANG